jgi:hypothetical protein
MADSALAKLIEILAENPQEALTLRDGKLFEQCGVSSQDRDELLSKDPARIKAVIEKGAQESGNDDISIHIGPIIVVVVVA